MKMTLWTLNRLKLNFHRHHAAAVAVAATAKATAAGPTTESSPKPPSGGQQFKALADAMDEGGLGGAKDAGFAFGSAKSGAAKQGLGFTLKF